ncbi:MAG: hypothetical protein V1847_04400 [Candidatus Diapherotrites archaeon]
MFGNLFENPDAFVQEYAANKPSEPSSYSTSSSGNAVVIALDFNPFAAPQADAEYLRHLSDVVQNLHASGFKIAVVCGAQSIVSGLHEVARSSNAPKPLMEEGALHSSQNSAVALIGALPVAFEEPVYQFQDVFFAWNKGKIPVLALSWPGLSTQAFGALLSEYLGASLCVVQEAEGIIGKPKKAKKEKLLEHASHDDLLDVCFSGEGAAQPLDVFAAVLLRRSKTRASFISHSNLDELEKAVRDSPFQGTRVE